MVLAPLADKLLEVDLAVVVFVFLPLGVFQEGVPHPVQIVLGVRKGKVLVPVQLGVAVEVGRGKQDLQKKVIKALIATLLS